MKLRILLRLIAIVQLLLGVLYLLVPGWLLHAIGHSAAAPDLYYPLAMLAARFIAYGIGLLMLAASSQPSRFWLQNMVLIQVLDLLAGVWYTANGVVPLQLSAFPMFNAALFACLLWRWQPPRAEVAA